MYRGKDSPAKPIGDDLSHRQAYWFVPAIFIVVLVPCSFVSMALFHTLVELFAIGIAVMSFVVAWNTFPLSRNHTLLYLGCGYFWIGIIDLLHTLSFQNMVALPAVNGGTSIQFWIVARYFEAFLLLSSPFMMVSRFDPGRIFMVMGLVSVLTGTSIFLDAFPEMYIPGTGLTRAKIFSEYAIILLLLVAALVYYTRARELDTKTRRRIIFSILFTVIAELNFTLYVGLQELPIIVGHVFKLLSFWLIYRVLVEASLLRPVKSLSQIVASYDAVSDESVVIDQRGFIQRANRLVRDHAGDAVVGRHCHDILHRSLPRDDCKICLAIKQKQGIQAYEFEDVNTGEWFEASLSGIHFSENFSAMIHAIRPISERKKTELQVVSLNRLYSVLSHTNQAITRISTQNELFQEICNIAVQFGEFKMSWIGIINGSTVSPEFIAGDDAGYLKEMQMRVDDSEWAKGPVGKAAKTRNVACVNNVKTDPDFWPWREAAIERGYAALAAVPLKSNGQVVGLFTLYSVQEDVFDADMLALLANLSDDLSSAIFHIQQAEQKRLADATIRKLSSAIEQSANAIFIANTDGVIEYVNTGFVALTGYSEAEILGQRFSILQAASGEENDPLWTTLSNGGNWQGEILSRKKNGDQFWAIQSISPVKNGAGEITHYVSTSTDNSELHQAQQTIENLAFYDPLTGLANRRLLMNRLEHAVAGATRHEELVAVLLFDLDNFKTINDSLGHDYGDELLKHVAASLTGSVRADDTVARLGGDEFVIVLDGIQGEGNIIDIADAVLLELEKPIELMGHQLAVSSSIGVAVFPQDGQQAAELLRNADLAMYHAKGEGKSRFQFYQGEMNDKAQGRLTMEHQLRRAIEEASFQLVYQPQVALSDGRIVGFEALIRWHQDGRVISPTQFIPLAEETGIIGAIGDWVLKQAFKDWQILQDMGFADCSMAVNVAAHQFKQAERLQEEISDLLDKNPQCDAAKFTVELTESTLIQNVEDTAVALNRLKMLGVSISIDDFGTGYSSLNYLKRFPIDQLKIDRSFVQDLLDDPNDQAIVSAIIALAQKLDMKVVAEGVELKGQCDSLLEQGCGFAQGFYYYKPMSIEQINAL